MAEVILFHYQSGATILHQADTRFKLLLLFIYSSLIFRLDSIGIIIISVVIIALFLKVLPKPASLMRQLRGALFLLIIIFTASLLSTKGVPVHQSFEFITAEGLKAGFLASWRFLMIILVGLIFSSTTLPENIHLAVYRLLKPIPFVQASLIASRISLTIMFIPSLLDMLNEIMEARKARYIEGSRNPVRNIISAAVPIAAGIIFKAEDNAAALESRLYTGEIRVEKKKPHYRDYLFLISGLVPAAAALSFQIIN